MCALNQRQGHLAAMALPAAVAVAVENLHIATRPLPPAFLSLSPLIRRQRAIPAATWRTIQ